MISGIAMKSWITTLGGMISATGAMLVAMDAVPEEYKWIGPSLLGLGSLILGASAKDARVHSTEKEVAEATIEKVAIEEKAK